MFEPRRAYKEVCTRVHNPDSGGGQGLRDAATAQPRTRHPAAALALRLRARAALYASATLEVRTRRHAHTHTLLYITLLHLPMSPRMVEHLSDRQTKLQFSC